MLGPAPRRFLSLFVSMLLFLGTLCTPGAALAQSSAAAGYWEFITTTDCEQLIMGQDDNAFPHSQAAFSSRYVLDSRYQSVLFSMCKNDKEYNKIIEYLQKQWSGSCYGVVSTIVLNKLTTLERGYIQPGFRASDMQSGAQDYFSIGYPSQNKQALNWINYYMLSQIASSSTVGATTLVRSGRVGGKMTYDTNDLTDLKDEILSFVNNDKPFLFSYGYTAKDGKARAHAIVGCDYYYDDTTSILYLKFYDENDRGMAARYGTVPHFCYIKLHVEGGKAYPLPAHTTSNGHERIYLYEYDYSDGKYHANKLLTYLRTSDMETIYENLKRGGGLTAQTQTAANYLLAAGANTATLTLEDIAGYDANTWRIKPFAYGADVNDIRYAERCGRLYRMPFAANAPLGGAGEVDPPATGDYPPIPVDDRDADVDFIHMTDYRYASYGDGDTLDMEIDLTDHGDVEGADEAFDGYDLVLSDAYLPGASLAKGDQYAWVGGEGLDYVRFSSDGRLRDVIAGADGGALELYFGTDSAETGLDMFRFAMNDFGFLQVYDQEDDPTNPDFRDSVVLRTDGLGSGFDFTFYRGELLSDDYEGEIQYADTDDVWLKIKAERDARGELGVSVWEEAESDGLPTFEGEPFFTSLFHEHTFPAGSSDAGTAAHGDSFGSYAFQDPVNGEPTPAGLHFIIDAPFSRHTGAAVDQIPLQKGVDYDAAEGSTLITLRPAFLASLKAGSHTLRVNFTDGAAVTTFTTPLSALVPVPALPATGGAPLWTYWLRW